VLTRGAWLLLQGVMRALHLPPPRLPPPPASPHGGHRGQQHSPGSSAERAGAAEHAALSLSSNDTSFAVPGLPDGGQAALPAVAAS
jgi:hypothetical protein